MVRPRQIRRIGRHPRFDSFKPAGMPAHHIESIRLHADELEAIRLKDYEGKDQQEAAIEMHISQPTFHRLLLHGRKKIVQALVEGHTLLIGGGPVRCRKKGCKECN